MKNQQRRSKIKIILLVLLLVSFGSFGLIVFKIQERKYMVKESTLSGVVVSNPIVYSLVTMITDGVHTPILLTDSSTASVHDYKLKPSQVRIISEAEIIFMLANEIETFLVGAIPEDKKVEITKDDSIKVQSYDQYDMNKFLDRNSSVSLKDYHVWLDPVIASKMLDVIYKKVTEKDTHNIVQYTKNLEKAKANLLSLSKEVNEILIPARDKKFITYHQSLGYFQKAFGVNIVGSIFIEGEDSTHGHTHSGAKYRSKKPSEIQYLTQAVEFITTSGITCLIRDDEIPEELSFGATTKIKEVQIDTMGFKLVPSPQLYSKIIKGIANNIANCASALQ